MTQKKKANSRKRKLKKSASISVPQLMVSILIGFIVMILLMLFSFRPTIVSNSAMTPTLEKNDVILVKKESKHFEDLIWLLVELKEKHLL